MERVLGKLLCDLSPKVKVKGNRVGICDGVPSTAALVFEIELDCFENFRGEKLNVL